MRKRRANPKEKEKLDSQRKQQRDRKLQILWDIKREKGCARCSESDPRCLTFHHLRDKKFSIMLAAHNNTRLEVLLNEVNKCEVLCANCHAKEHIIDRFGE